MHGWQVFGGLGAFNQCIDITREEQQFLSKKRNIGLLREGGPGMQPELGQPKVLEHEMLLL